MANLIEESQVYYDALETQTLDAVTDGTKKEKITSEEIIQVRNKAEHIVKSLKQNQENSKSKSLSPILEEIISKLNRQIAEKKEEVVKNTQYSTSTSSSVNFGENPLRTFCSSPNTIEETQTSVNYSLGSSFCFQNDITIIDKQDKQSLEDPKLQKVEEEELKKTTFRVIIPIKNK